jgi:hypothetical protein
MEVNKEREFFLVWDWIVDVGFRNEDSGGDVLVF